MLGGIQHHELSVPPLLDHAAREHGRCQIVICWADGRERRTDWAGVAVDARQLTQVLLRLGVGRGERAATLVMNHAHILRSDTAPSAWAE